MIDLFYLPKIVCRYMQSVARICADRVKINIRNGNAASCLRQLSGTGLAEPPGAAGNENIFVIEADFHLALIQSEIILISMPAIAPPST